MSARPGALATRTPGLRSRPGVEALPQLERTHKIFFVNDWLAAFVNGQVDGAALERVASLTRDAKLDPELRLKMLEAMDGLARTVKIRARFAAS